MCLTVNIDECKQFYSSMEDKIKCYKIVKEINKQLYPLYFDSVVYTLGKNIAEGVEVEKPAHLNKNNAGLERCLVRFGYHVYTSLDECMIDFSLLQSYSQDADKLIVISVECEKEYFLGYSNDKAVFSQITIRRNYDKYTTKPKRRTKSRST